MNTRAFLPFRNPVMLICIFFGQGYFSSSSWLYTNSTMTSSSMFSMSVIFLLIHGRSTSSLTFDMSTRLLRLSPNFICFNSFFSLSLKRVSCCWLVPVNIILEDLFQSTTTCRENNSIPILVFFPKFHHTDTDFSLSEIFHRSPSKKNPNSAGKSVTNR